MDNQYSNNGTEQVRTQQVTRETRTVHPLRPSGGRKAVAALLSILLFISLLSVLLLGQVRWLTRQSTVETILIEDDTVYERPDSSPFTFRTVMSDAFAPSDPDDNTLPFNLEPDTFTEYIERSTWPEFIASGFGGMLQDLVDGTRTTHLQDSDYHRVVEENMHVLEEVTGTAISPEMAASLIDSLNGQSGISLNADTLFEVQDSGDLAMVRLFLSRAALIGLTITSVILALAIILVMRGRYRWFSPNLAIPLILAGLVILGFSLLMPVFNRFMWEPDPTVDVLLIFTTALGQRFLIFGLGALALGAVLLIIRAILPKPKGSDPYETATQRPNPYMN